MAPANFESDDQGRNIQDEDTDMLKRSAESDAAQRVVST